MIGKCVWSVILKSPKRHVVTAFCKRGQQLGDMAFDTTETACVEKVTDAHGSSRHSGMALPPEAGIGFDHTPGTKALLDEVAG